MRWPLLALLALSACHVILPLSSGREAPTAEAAPIDDSGADSNGPVDAHLADAAGLHLAPAWSVHVSGAQTDWVSGVTVDVAGNVYATGFFMGPLVVNGQPCCTAASAMDLFLVKLSSGGAQVWIEHPADGDVGWGHQVLVDGNGDLRLVGEFSQSMSFGQATLPAYDPSALHRDSFLATYQADTPIFKSVVPISGPGFTHLNRIAQSSGGGIYLTGDYSQSLTIGQTTSAAGVGGSDIFVAGIAPTGALLWSSVSGTPGADTGTAIAVDGAGNVFVTGQVGRGGTVNLGGGPRQLVGDADVFVASFDPGGQHRWSRILGGTDYDQAAAITVDGAGNVFVTGSGVGPIDFGDGNPRPSLGQDAFLVSYTSEGTMRWSRLLGGPTTDAGVALALRRDGEVALAGDFSGAIDLGGGPLTAVQGSDNFVVILDGATGSHVWSTSFGGKDDSHVADLVGDSVGNLYLGGYFEGDLALGAAVLTSPDSLADGFVVKLEPR